MAMREDVITSATTFLQDPNVVISPIESRIAFLQSKNLTPAEVDAALARAGASSPPSMSTSNNGPDQYLARHPQYGTYPQYPFQRPQDANRRDWRDWFIMTTLFGGVGYGIYVAAKRYVYPIIAPPTTPQLQQDKNAIDESFERAFVLLDQLAKDTESLKASELARTQRLDTALADVEAIVSELKDASRRREDDHRRINDEVRGLKDLIPRAMEGQRESADNRLKDLNTEMKSLKILMSQRFSSSSPSVASTSLRNSSSVAMPSEDTSASNGDAATDAVITTAKEKQKPVSKGVGGDPVTSLQARGQDRGQSHFSGGTGKAAIPAWQMAAANRPSTPANEDGEQSTN